jgi:hypothetical protein
MGGNVGVIVKKEDGQQIGMSRWTNVMPYHFRNINLYLGKTSEWYKEFSSEWLEMKEDYEDNKDTGQFKQNMTSVYFPHDTLSPDEYGIIAVDLKNKKIYSSQDYCSIGALPFYILWDRHGDNEENKELINQYLQHGLIKQITYYARESASLTYVDITSLTPEDLFQLLDEIGDRKVTKFSHPLFANISKEDLELYSASFPINSDWQFITYHDRTVGVLKIKKELDKDGFVFTEKDNEAWKKYVSWRFEDEDEEALKDNKTYQEFKELYLDVFKEPFVIPKSD